MNHFFKSTLLISLAILTLVSCNDNESTISNNNNNNETVVIQYKYSPISGSEYNTGAYCLAASINLIKGYSDNTLPDADDVTTEIHASMAGIETATSTYLSKWASYGYPKILASGIAITSKLSKYGLNPEVHFYSSQYSSIINGSSNQININSDTIVNQEKRFLTSKGIVVKEYSSSNNLQSFLANSTKKNFIILVEDGSQYIALHKNSNNNYSIYDPVLSIFNDKTTTIEQNTINVDNYFTAEFAGIIIAFN